MYSNLSRVIYLPFESDSAVALTVVNNAGVTVVRHATVGVTEGIPEKEKYLFYHIKFWIASNELCM